MYRYLDAWMMPLDGLLTFVVLMIARWGMVICDGRLFPKEGFHVSACCWQMLSFKKVFQSTDYIGYCTAKTLVKNQLFSGRQMLFSANDKTFALCNFCAIFASCAKVQKLQVTRLQGVQVVASSCNFPTSSPSTPP